MMRKGSMDSESRQKLIEVEAKCRKKEERLKNKAIHHRWGAGGKPGSASHHHIGDEFKGKRRKAADDESTDSSDDEEEQLDEAKLAVHYAEKYLTLVRTNRELLQSLYATAMMGSLEYAEDLKDAEAFVAETRLKCEQIEANQGYEERE